MRGVPAAAASAYRGKATTTETGSSASAGNGTGDKDGPLPTAKLVRLQVRYQPLDAVDTSPRRPARGGSSDEESGDAGAAAAEVEVEVGSHTKVVGAHAPGELIHGRYASASMDGARYLTGGGSPQPSTPNPNPIS